MSKKKEVKEVKKVVEPVIEKEIKKEDIAIVEPQFKVGELLDGKEIIKVKLSDERSLYLITLDDNTTTHRPL